MSSTYAAYYHHQFDYRQPQFAHHPSQPLYQPPHHHPSQPINQPPHYPIGSLDLQQSYPLDRHFHPQHHPYQARQPTCWDPPWVRTQQTSSTYDQSPPRPPSCWDPPVHRTVRQRTSWDLPNQHQTVDFQHLDQPPPPHSPYLAYGESTYQGSDPNNPDFMDRSFSPAQLAAVNDYNEKLRVYRLDQAALLARVTAWFEENTDDENITEENIGNTPTMVLSADVPNNVTDVAINTAVGVDVSDEIEQSEGSQDKAREMLRDNKVLPRSALQVLPQNRMIGGQRLLDKDGVGQVSLNVLDIAMAHRNLLRRYAKEFFKLTRSRMFLKSVIAFDPGGDPPAYWETPGQLPFNEVSVYDQPLSRDPNSGWNQPAPWQPRPATTEENPIGAMLNRLLEACNRMESRLDATDRRINNLHIDEVYGSLKSLDVAATSPLNLDIVMLEENKGNDGGNQPMNGEDTPNISVEEKSKSSTTRQKEKLYAEEEDLLDVEEGDGLLQAFQVANFEYIDEAERAVEDEISAPPPEGQASLNKLERASFMVYRLWDKYEVQKVDEFEARGKGKRSLKQMVSRESSSKQENLLRVVGHDLIRAEHMINRHRSVALEADGRFIPPRNNTQCLGSIWRDPIQFSEVHFVLCRFLNSSEILFQLRALIQLGIQGGWRMFEIEKVTSRKTIECLLASWLFTLRTR